MTNAEQIKLLIKDLLKKQEEIQRSEFMTTDNCPADKAYKLIGEACEFLTEAIGMSFEEAEKFLEASV